METRRVATVTSAALAAAILAACGGTTGLTGPGTIVDESGVVASVAVEPSSLTLFVGESQTLEAVVLNPDGEAVEDVQVQWTSSNTDVATVTQDGLVTGVSVGQATITATAQDESGEAAVDVSSF